MTDKNLSEANAWRGLDNWITEHAKRNPDFARVKEEVSAELSKDGCYSAWIHHAALIERLAELLDYQ